MLFMRGIIGAMQDMSANFLTAPMEHWCMVPELQNVSHDQQKYVAIPYEDGETGEYDSCYMYDIDYSSLTEEDIFSWNRSATENMTTIPCTDWVFDRSEFVETIVSKVWMSEYTASLQMLSV